MTALPHMLRTLTLALMTLAVVAAAPSAQATENACRPVAPDPAFVAAMMTDPVTRDVEKRFALVIGNSAYSPDIGFLANPVNDAKAVAGMLNRIGFTVFLVLDASAADITACADKLREFAKGSDVGILYYSGHGIQVDDKNYLVAVDATSDTGTLKGFVDVQPLVETLTGSAAASLVFLDACRNNPLAADGREGLSVQTGRGLKRVAAQETGSGAGVRHANGLLVSYSTSPNAVALDGEGRYSPFTEAFLQHAGTPGYSIQRVLSEVANSVGEATDWSQSPWTRSSLTAELKLVGIATAEEVQAASVEWAHRARKLLDRGRRTEAIAAALRGIPAGASDAVARQTYRAAYEELARAYLSGNAPAIPDLAKIEGPLFQGFWVSPDRQRYVVGYNGADERMNISLHRASDGRRLAMLLDGLDTANYLTMVSVSADGGVVSAAIDDTMYSWRMSDGALIGRFDGSLLLNPTGRSSLNYNLVLSPSGRKILGTGLLGEAAGVFDTSNGLFWPLDAERFPQLSTELQRMLAGPIKRANFSFMSDSTLCFALDDGRQIVIGRYDLDARTVSVSGAFVSRAEEGDIFDTFVVCSPDGRRAVLVEVGEQGSGSWWLWDMTRGKVVRQVDRIGHSDLLVERGNPRYIAFDRGSRFVAIEFEGVVAVYDSRNGAWIDHATGDKTAVFGGLIGRDGTAVARGPSNAGVDFFWTLLPTGTGIVGAASDSLTPDEIQTVSAERIRVWSPN